MTDTEAHACTMKFLQLFPLYHGLQFWREYSFFILMDCEDLVVFASNILQCGKKMYSVNNSHCVNIISIEHVLGLVVIHPIFSHLNLWQFNKSAILINRTHIQKSMKHATFFPSFFLSIITLIKKLSRPKTICLS